MTTCTDIRALVLEQLQIEVLKNEDMFLCNNGDYFKRIELNHYAIAEWAYNLLERQREVLTQAVERAFDEEQS